MNRRIIILQGISNTGKTETLKYLIDKLKKHYKVTVLFKGGGGLVVTVNVDNKVLGISTYGDTKSDLENDFKSLGTCDLYVCACRTKGETINFIRNETRNGTLITHGKWYFYEKNSGLNCHVVQEELNQKQADYLFYEIMHVI